ncbi:MAG: efflux RND transporter permease subunit [Planctomycetia bacterium]|nr:efflux RND transporter permease subunit [Planctomycetia bacterium]
MSLSDLSIRNPVFAVMLAAAMMVFGWLGYRQMGVSQFPEVDFPVISITITREAASPDIMDGDVTSFVEEAVAGVEGVDYVMSRSLEGTSLVTIFFRLDRNIDVAMQDVSNAISGARRKLPLDIDPPVITKVNPNDLPVMWLALSGPVPLHTISDFAEKGFKERLATIPGVGGIQFGGLQSRNIRIWLDAEKLASYNLAVDEVLDSLKRQHAELPAGYLQSRLVELNVRTMGEAYSLKELENLVIAQKDGQPIRLHDVAVVEDGMEDRRSLARFNRMPSVAVGVRKAVGGNLVSVCENVKNAVPELRKLLPAGVQLDIPVDYSLFIRENVAELQLTLILGILLTALVCFLFLGSLGTTLNICISIPTSLLGTFFFIRYGVPMLGMEPFTINLMTLLGLSLSVGVVVDDAILVLENIHRHREKRQGATPEEDRIKRKKAALYGAREITFAALAATLSIVAIFLPVAFMQGTIGKFFFQFGVTVSVAVLLSLVCSLTMTPMLCAFFLNIKEKYSKRPRPWKWKLAIILGVLAVIAMAIIRWRSTSDSWGYTFSWWMIQTLQQICNWLHLPYAGLFQPEQAMGWHLRGLWALQIVCDLLLLAILFRYATTVYWAFDRYILTGLILRPVDYFLEGLSHGYRVTLRWALAAWPVVLLFSFFLIVLAGWMIYAKVLGTELVPSEDQSRFVVRVICPVGSSIQQVDQLLQECEAVLVQHPDILGLLTTVATEPGQLMNEADIFVQLTPHRDRTAKQKEIISQVRQQLEQVRDVRIIVRDLSTEGFTAQSGEPIDFALQGDWKTLPTKVRAIMEEMNATGLVQDVDSDFRPGMTELQVVPNRDKLALVQIPAQKVADTISLLVGGQRVAKFTDRGRRYDVRARLQSVQRATPDQMDPLLIRGAGNRLVPLVDLIDRQTIATLPIIHRYAYQRKIEITANPIPGVSQGDALEVCRKIMLKHLPEAEGNVVELGNSLAMRETISSLVFALILGIIVAYMILGVQFASFIHPLTVLLAMPFAVTGALVTLWWGNDTLNMMSMIGLVLLMGLVKKNSIILVDYTNQVREGKADELSEPGSRTIDEAKQLEDMMHPRFVMPPDEAVIKACPIRLRPILMTSIATIAGAVPAALGLGPGAETRAPMAKAIIGGILLSTLVTLYLVPVFYVLVEQLRARLGQMIQPAK